jgi:GNAT superfamily N-acetyltransferase
MSDPVVAQCTKADFDEIVAELDEFWETPRTYGLHLSVLINEFGNTAYVVRDQSKVVAYLFGFFSQMEPVGYVHLIAVRRAHRGRGLGERLYEHFADQARRCGYTGLKAITTPENSNSISFHRRIGMEAELVTDYSGRGKDRIVFRRKI